MIRFLSHQLALCACLALLVSASLEARDWQMQDGSSVDADFYFRDSRETWFKDHEGKLYVVENSAVSAEDREFIARLETFLTDLKFKPWPRQIQPDRMDAMWTC